MIFLNTYSYFSYELALSIIDIVASTIFFFMLGVSWYYVGYIFLARKKIVDPIDSDKKTHFGVLIAARNESNVIRHILNALKHQNYDKSFYDVWVIIEDESDPTFNIVKKYDDRFHVYVRKKPLGNRLTKGFALQECINYFYENDISYDAYMIFDADNVMEVDFLRKMNNLRQSGVQVGVGYRNFTNANQNWITCCSATLFSYMNQITSKGRTILFKKATLTGTGYFIDADIVKNAGGWIFTGMTEDVQLTTYCYYHNINMRYYPHAIYFDEQASKYKTVHRQHVRWVWGYFASRKFLKKKEPYYNATSRKTWKSSIFEWNVSIYPMVIYVIGNLLLVVISLIMTIFSIFEDPNYTSTFFWHFGYQILLLYVSFMVVALLVIINDNKNLKFNFATIIWTLLTYCIFFFDFLLAFLDGLFFKKKRTVWKTISHDGTILDERARLIEHYEESESRLEEK